jgi:hypothetical protein
MYLTKLIDIKGVTSQEIVPILLLLLITIVTVSQTQAESSVSLAEGQAQNNATKGYDRYEKHNSAPGRTSR